MPIARRDAGTGQRRRGEIGLEFFEAERGKRGGAGEAEDLRHEDRVWLQTPRFEGGPAKRELPPDPIFRPMLHYGNIVTDGFSRPALICCRCDRRSSNSVAPKKPSRYKVLSQSSAAESFFRLLH